MTQKIPLDQYPDTPLDQFPDILHRQVVADVGLDGLTDAMELEVDGNAFETTTRTPDSAFASYTRTPDSSFVEQNRAQATWVKIA